MSRLRTRKNRKSTRKQSGAGPTELTDKQIDTMAETIQKIFALYENFQVTYKKQDGLITTHLLSPQIERLTQKDSKDIREEELELQLAGGYGKIVQDLGNHLDLICNEAERIKNTLRQYPPTALNIPK